MPSMIRMLLLTAALVVAAVPVWAADKIKAPSADARFDKTGDGIVDAEDWQRMDAEEKRAYARESLRELGLDPVASIGNGKTRSDDFLAGLRSVYGP